MKFGIENLGPIKQAEIELGKKLTVFTGPNNTGKSWAMYVLWAAKKETWTGALTEKEIKKLTSFFFDSLNKNGEVDISLTDNVLPIKNILLTEHFEDLVSMLSRVFFSPPEIFAQTKILTEITDEEYSQNFSTATLPPDTFRFQRIPMRAEKYHSGFKIYFGGKVEISNQDVQRDDLFSALRSAINFYLLYVAPRSINIVFQYPFFFLPSERGGLVVTYRDLDRKSANIMRELKQVANNRKDLASEIASTIENLRISEYPMPVKDYVDFLSTKTTPRAMDTNKFSDRHTKYLEDHIAKANYIIDENGEVFAQPINSNVRLPLHMASGTIKSLFGLWLFLKTSDGKGVIFIDEPELNLHPHNQRLVARLLARIVNDNNCNYRIIFSTHSDYIVRELNNLIMLGNEFPDRDDLAKSHKIDASEYLKFDEVKAYQFPEDGIVTACKLTAEFGIEITNMDDVILDMNRTAGEISFNLSDYLRNNTKEDSPKDQATPKKKRKQSKSNE